MKYVQKLPLSLESTWNFFSSPSNLKLLTPHYLDFKITNSLENSKIYAGQIISYTIKPFWNFPIEWVTEITHVKEPYYFIDEQRFGPYEFWHHEHWFKSISEGVEMTDIIYYKMPFGLIGKGLHLFKIKRTLQEIFNYRYDQIEKILVSNLNLSN